MAIPFYNQGDQEIYESGNKFIPQEQYRLGYTPPPSIANAPNTGITNTQAANPYIYPPQGDGGGGGGGGSGNKFGLNLDTQKTITVGMANQAGVYVPTEINIAQTDGGMWKNVDTNQNVYHGNIDYKGVLGTVMDKAMGKKTIPGAIQPGSTTGTEWDEDLDPAIAHKKLNMIQRWKAKKKAGVQAQFEKDVAAARPSLQAQSAENKAGDTGGWQSGMAQDEAFMTGPAEGEQLSDTMASFAYGGRIGFKDGLSPYQIFKLKELGYGKAGSNPGSYGGLSVLRDILKLHKYKHGGRIGYAYGTTDPEEPAEDIHEIMRGENIPFGEQVEGEGDILSMLIAKYIEAGFPPDQAEEMAMQELQQMSADPGQGEGLAGLV
jgi:hypothetical protein